MKKAKTKPIAPDLKRCQAEMTLYEAFRCGGSSGVVRCKRKPICVVRERKPGKDGQCGSMSLCEICEPHLYEQQPASDFVRTVIGI